MFNMNDFLKLTKEAMDSSNAMQKSIQNQFLEAMSKGTGNGHEMVNSIFKSMGESMSKGVDLKEPNDDNDNSSTERFKGEKNENSSKNFDPNVQDSISQFKKFQ